MEFIVAIVGFLLILVSLKIVTNLYKTVEEKSRSPIVAAIAVSLCIIGALAFAFPNLRPRSSTLPYIVIGAALLGLALYLITKNLGNIPENENFSKEDILLPPAPAPEYDPFWGGWSPTIHADRKQKARCARSEKSNIYETTLSSCSCPDFAERRLPCKHIYSLAIAEGLIERDIPRCNDCGHPTEEGFCPQCDN